METFKDLRRMMVGRPVTLTDSAKADCSVVSQKRLRFSIFVVKLEVLQKRSCRHCPCHQNQSDLNQRRSQSPTAGCFSLTWGSAFISNQPWGLRVFRMFGMFRFQETVNVFITDSDGTRVRWSVLLLPVLASIGTVHPLLAETRKRWIGHVLPAWTTRTILHMWSWCCGAAFGSKICGSRRGPTLLIVPMGDRHGNASRCFTWHFKSVTQLIHFINIFQVHPGSKFKHRTKSIAKTPKRYRSIYIQ